MRVENDGDDIYKKISTPNECNGKKSNQSGVATTEKQSLSIIVKRYFGHIVRQHLSHQRTTKNHMNGQPKEVDRKIIWENGTIGRRP